MWKTTITRRTAAACHNKPTDNGAIPPRSELWEKSNGCDDGKTRKASLLRPRKSQDLYILKKKNRLLCLPRNFVAIAIAAFIFIMYAVRSRYMRSRDIFIEPQRQTWPKQVMLHDEHEAFEVDENDENDYEEALNDAVETRGYIYAFDDDFYRNTYFSYDDDQLYLERHCHRVSWYRQVRPTCNNLHEMNIAVDVPRHLNNGDSNDIFLVEHDVPEERNTNATVNSESIVWKQTRIDYDWDDNHFFQLYEDVRVDVMVSERLTSSEHIVDVYGHCGLAVLAEYFVGGDLAEVAAPTGGLKDSSDEVIIESKNNLTASEKLLLATSIAQSIATLHGFADGVIVHNDIHFSQFLVDLEGRIKLTDFNMAQIMLYDETNDEYCRHNNPVDAAGALRSPEEYAWGKLNEKVDVYSFGNLIFILLTGLWPCHEFQDEYEIYGGYDTFQEAVIEGYTPAIHDSFHRRSFAESKLFELMKLCWEYDPDERIDIFEAMEFLKLALEENTERAGKG